MTTARELGMGDVLPKVKLDITRNCLFCKKDFKVSNHSQKYCGKECAENGTKDIIRKHYHKNKQLKKERKRFKGLPD